MPDENLICPHCESGTLFLDEDAQIQCSECKKTYSNRNGIYLFTENDYFFGETSQEAAHELLNQIKREPERLRLMKQRLDTESLDEFRWKYIFSESRTSYIDYFLSHHPITRNRTSLDIGCGYGSVGAYFEKHGFKNYYIDLTRERLEFAYIKNNFFGYKNGVYIYGGDKNIPIKDESVGVASCIGVLEWIPSTQTRKPPEDEQLDFLKKIHSKIQTNGHLLLGIENRYAYPYLLGYPDDHTGMRFITFLPRFLSNFYSKLSGKGEYRNYLYGYRELKQLILRAGFKEVEIVYPHMDYRFAEHTVRFDDSRNIDNLLKQHAKNKGYLHKFAINLLRLANKIGWYKYIAYSFIAIARK